MPPVVAWDWYELVVTGNNPETSDYYYSGAFPVEVSDDKNTLVIQSVEEQGMTFYPAIGYMDYGMNYMGVGFQSIAEIQLTRGAVEAPARTAQKVENNKPAKSQNNRIKRVYLPTEDVKVKTVKMNYVPVLDLMQEKYSVNK